MTKKLDSKTVKKIAQLARLSNEPEKDFLDKYGEELGAIIGHVEELQKLDTKGISPLDGVRTITVEELREDEPEADQEKYTRIRQNIINNFPNHQGNLLILPGIFE